MLPKSECDLLVAVGVLVTLAALLVVWVRPCFCTELRCWTAGSNDLGVFFVLVEWYAFDFEQLLVPKGKL